jgi:hypothetical protein
MFFVYKYVFIIVRKSTKECAKIINSAENIPVSGSNRKYFIEKLNAGLDN